MSEKISRHASTAGLAVLLAAFAAPESRASEIEFASPRVLLPENRPKTVASGDFNEDGFPDFLTTRYVPGRHYDAVSILLSRGSADDYAPAVALRVANLARDIAVSDYDQDGHLDFFVACENDDVVGAFRGHGDGTFDAVQYLSALRDGDLCWAVAAADFDGDGRGDVAVANFLADTVGVGYGPNGVGFAATRFFTVGDGPQGLAAGDFDEDGLPDLAVCHLTSRDVCLLISHGSYSFQRSASFPIGGSGRDLVVADLNGDGHLDVAVGTEYPDGIAILEGDGAGNLLPARRTSGGGRTRSIATADFDGDGAPDLALAGFRVTCEVYLNDGGGGLLAPRRLLNTMMWANAVATGDFDDDGAADIVVASDERSSLYVIRGDGRGRFGQESTEECAELPRVVLTSDLDGDEDGDVVLVGATSLAVFAGDGSGHLAPAGVVPSGSDLARAAIGDFDGDGVADVVTADDDDLLLRVHGGDGHGSFGSPSLTSIPDRPFALAVGDFDENGRDDVASLCGTPTRLAIFTAGPTGRLAPAWEIPASFVGSSLAVADFDEDGHADLAFGSSGRTLTVRFGSGTGEFAVSAAIDVGVSASAGIAAADFDGDGHADMALVQRGPADDPYMATLAVIRGDGLGGFSAPTLLAGFSNLAAVLDVDRDGRPDLAAVDPERESLLVARNRGDGTFATPIRYGGYHDVFAPAAGDVDGDGYPELLFGCDDTIERRPVLAWIGNLTGGLVARRGNVNAGAGEVVDVLTVDAQVGDVGRRLVRVPANESLPIALAAPPSGGTGDFLLWILDGEPAPRAATEILFRRLGGAPSSLGIGCRPLPILNTATPGSVPCPLAFPLGWASRAFAPGLASALCVGATGASGTSPIEFDVVFPPGRFTVCGVVADPASAGDVRASLTNSVVVVSRPR